MTILTVIKENGEQLKIEVAENSMKVNLGGIKIE
jgi:hypothetical protein